MLRKKKAESLDNSLLHTNLVAKMHPQQHPGWSPKWMAHVAMILGEQWTDPTIPPLMITSDGFAVGFDNYFGGDYRNIRRNWVRFLGYCNLTKEEWDYAERLFQSRIVDCIGCSVIDKLNKQVEDELKSESAN